MLFVVAAALIDPIGRVLVQQRPAGGTMAGLWEFPGGKVEPDETPEGALSRELHEELGIMTHDFKPLGFASAPIENQHLVMLLYRCRVWQGETVAVHASRLQWLDPAELYTLPMPPADLPLIAALMRAV